MSFQQMIFGIFSVLLTLHLVAAEPCTLDESSTYNCKDRSLTQVPKRSSSSTVLNIEGNLIKVFKSDSFTTWSALTKLHAKGNPLERIEEDAFTPLNSLILLDLSETSLTINEEGLTKSVFWPIPFLSKLFLGKCRLKGIPDNFFGGLPRVEVLKINNQKGGLELGEAPFKGLISLKTLDIRGNNLRILSKNIFPERAKDLRLDSNNFMCDCHLRWIVDVKRSIKDNPVCAGPSLVANRPIRDLQRDDFQCKPEIISRSLRTSVHAGDTMRLSCSIHSDPRGTESWWKDGVMVYDNSTRISIERLEPSSVTGLMKIEVKNINNKDAGYWECRIENSAGKVSDKIHVEVLMSATFFIALPIIILFLSVAGVACLYRFMGSKGDNDEEDIDGETTYTWNPS